MKKMKIAFVIVFLILNLVSVFADFNTLMQRYRQTQGIKPSPQRYIKSGTGILFNLYQQWDLLDEEIKTALQTAAMQEPVREKFVVTPSGHFTLHWDESGYDAVPIEDISGNGIPDYIDSAMVIFDHVWQVEIEQMGFQAPLNYDGNTVDTYHVYFGYLKDGLNEYYGLTYYSLSDIPSIPGVNYTSYMEVHKDFADFPSPGLSGLKVTAAHEFNHAIQFGYNFREEDIYFYEMTATWIENFIYPEINDYYQYLRYFFRSVSNANFNLNNTSTNYPYGDYFPYGNALYLQMLEKKFAVDIVQEIWERLRVDLDTNALGALQYILSGIPYSSSWLESLQEYGLWLYYTGDRAISGQFFPDAAAYPSITIRSEDEIVFDQAYQNVIINKNLANRYVRILGINNLKLNIFMESSGSPSGGFRQLTNAYYSPFYPLNEPISIDPIASDTSIIMICNAEEEEVEYSLDIKMASNIDPSEVVAYPNPVNISLKGEYIRFLNIPADADLNIYNMAGKRMARIPSQENPGVRTWNLRNESGESVASGIYIYYVKGDNLEQTGKFSVVR